MDGIKSSPKGMITFIVNLFKKAVSLLPAKAPNKART
jgi:hypothetical protein